MSLEAVTKKRGSVEKRFVESGDGQCGWYRGYDDPSRNTWICVPGLFLLILSFLLLYFATFWGVRVCKTGEKKKKGPGAESNLQ